MSAELMRLDVALDVPVGHHTIHLRGLGAEYPIPVDEAEALTIADAAVALIEYGGQLVAWWKVDLMGWLRAAGLNYGVWAARLGLTKKTAMHYLDAFRIPRHLRRDDVPLAHHIIVSRFWEQPETVARLLAEAAGCNVIAATFDPQTGRMVAENGEEVGAVGARMTVKEFEDRVQVLQAAGSLGNGAPDNGSDRSPLTNDDPVPGEGDIEHMLDVAAVEGWDSRTTARALVDWLCHQAPDGLIALILRERGEVA